MQPQDYEQRQLAKFFITRVSDQIGIPSDIHATLKGQGKNLVGVLPGDSKKMVFFMTNATQILVVRLFLNKDQLNETFFTSLRNVLGSLKMTNLFSTGVCFKAEMCVWEGVFEYEDEKNFTLVQEKLTGVTFVMKAKFEKVTLQ